MKKYLSLLVLSIAFFTFTSCEDDSNATIQNIDFVSFETESFNFGVDIDGANTNEFNVYTSKVTGADRTYSITVNESLSTADPASYTVPASIVVPSGSNTASFPIEIKDLNIGSDGKTLVVEFAEQDGISTGKEMILNISQICPLNDVKFSMVLDSWPEEVYWRLSDSAGNIIGTSSATPGFGGYAGMSGSIALDFCLPNDTYLFEVFDGYGDGAGAISISLADGTSLFSSDGAYGSGTSGSFTL
ncbi:hypothetical protein LPB136_00210 [Tenacibaculum todarodis]|uniref:DUF1735 domain-containing protein n=1 Tax=Tenacibaculum todarodis TaxID=1850252 RepID=A0A1L3JFH1_9FLAO|nr:DUF1735 domain-containing protein [Tenacibaculum todarodis]APG63885.1 hypothetical protein LPB136_00210 [Tenacibaculum todarodis]